MNNKKRIFSTICLFFLLQISFSQSGNIDPTFNVFDNGVFGNGFGINDGSTSIVYATKLQLDGKILIGGSFTNYNGTTNNRIVRLNSDGSQDMSFNSGAGFNGAVRAIIIQSDGKIIIGGEFTSYNGLINNKIIRLNNDGSVDNSFSTGIGFNNNVYALDIHSSGNIIVGGDFTSFNGNTIKSIAKLNTNGVLDLSFYPNLIVSNIVRALAIQTDGKIIVGGFFSYSPGVNNIARLNYDGTLDTTFAIGSGLNGSQVGNENGVSALAIQSDGKILVGGYFYRYNNIQRNYFVRLNTDGTLDNSSRYIGISSIVYSIDIQQDGKFIVADQLGPKRFNNDCSIDNTFTSIQDTSMQQRKYVTLIQPDGKIIIGGAFSGEIFKRLARINSDGSIDMSFNPMPGFNNGVLTTSIQSDGKIITGGSFIRFNGIEINRIARLNFDGSLDTTFNPGLGFNDIVYSTSIQSDGKIIVGGLFTSFNGINVKRIARLNSDGSFDSTFNTGTGFNGFVSCLNIQQDGKILVGGSFSSFNGVARNNYIRLNSNGTFDTTFNSGVNSGIRKIIIQPDGKIIICGGFYNGIYEGIARINPNGNLDTTFNPGTGFNNGDVWDILLQPDGKIIVGGGFYCYDEFFNSCQNVVNRIARINANGSLDTTFNIGTGFDGYVYCLKLQLDGKILVGGYFSSYNGIPNNGFVRLNPNGSLDTNFNPSITIYPSTINIQSDNKIILGGNSSFSNTPPVQKNGIVRLFNDINLSNSEVTSSYNSQTILSPNPNKGLFNLKTNKIGKNYFVFDMLGRIIYTGTINDENTQINIQNNIDGIYFLKLENDLVKIIKN